MEAPQVETPIRRELGTGQTISFFKSNWITISDAFVLVLICGTGENCILGASFNPTCIVVQCLAGVFETCSMVI